MMSGPHNPALAPLATRWQTFLEKVRARVQEIAAEAAAGYQEVVAHDAVDGTALSGVSSALKARLLALGQKLDDSFDTIDAELDKLDLDDAREAGRFRGQMLALKAQARHWLDVETERMIVTGEALAARALHAVAMQEAAAPIACQHCGAPLHRPVWHQSVNITCGSCRAVTTATPGTASVMFVAGAGAIQLAREQAFPAWIALQDAERQWHRLRHKTTDDLARWEAANRGYWQAFADAMGRLHPGWTAKHVADEVTGKMSWFLSHDALHDQAERAANQRAVAAVASGDPGQVQAWVAQQRDRDEAVELLVMAALERGWQQHVPWLGHVLGVPSDTLDEHAYYFATRGD